MKVLALVSTFRFVAQQPNPLALSPRSFRRSVLTSAQTGPPAADWFASEDAAQFCLTARGGLRVWTGLALRGVSGSELVSSPPLPPHPE